MEREELFDEDYLYFYETFLTDERSDAETDVVWKLLELEEGMEVLDLACGHGRIANRLAARGTSVTGLDATPLFLRIAREDAERRGVDVEYVEGDMRELPWEGRFDVVLSWFTSFGYFDDDDNRRVLREAAKALKPGGRVLVNIQNLAVILRERQRFHVGERDDDFLIDEMQFDLRTSRVETDRTIVRGGRTRRTHYALRSFMPAELGDWLRQSGFRDVEFYDGEGGELTLTAWRMCAVARR